MKVLYNKYKPKPKPPEEDIWTPVPDRPYLFKNQKGQFKYCPPVPQ